METSELLKIMAQAAFVVSGVFGITAVILFFKLNIRDTANILLKRSSKREHKESRGDKRAGLVSLKLRKEQRNGKGNQILDEAKTELLEVSHEKGGKI